MAQADPPNEAENESHRSPTQKERFPTECWTMLVVTGGEHLIPGNNQAEVEGVYITHTTSALPINLLMVT